MTATTSERADAMLERLQALADPHNVQGMGRFGMATDQRLGISVPEMRKLAKEVGKDHQLALALWDSGVQEACMVAGMVAEPELLTEQQMERWVLDINSWDVCDQLCSNLLEKSPLAVKKIHDWSLRNIGKRNLALNRAALALAKQLQEFDSRAARWIANDAIRELESDKVQGRLKD